MLYTYKHMSLEDQTLDKIEGEIEETGIEKSETTFVSKEGELKVQKENPISNREQIALLKKEIANIRESRDKVRSAQAYGIEEAALPESILANAKLPLEDKENLLKDLIEINKKQNRGVVRKFLSLFSF